MRKGKDPDPYLWLIDPDTAPRMPKYIRILRIRIRNTAGNHGFSESLVTIFLGKNALLLC